MITVAGLLLVFVLPALAGGVLLAGPSRSDQADGEHGATADVTLARGLACGLAAWLFASGLLAATVEITETSAWICAAAIAAASAVVLALPRNRALVRAWIRSAGRRFAESAGLSALVYAPLSYAIVHTSWSPLGSTPWYYYGLARQVADAGSVPTTSVEFATSTPFLNDYHLFTTGTAMLLSQGADEPMTALTAITLLGVLLIGVGAAAITTALGAGRRAALIAVPLAVATGIAPIRLAAYRPEGFALGMTLLVAALSIDWLRRRDWRSLVSAAVLAAALSQVHGIAAVTAGAMAVAAAIVSLSRGRRVEQLRRAGIALAAIAGIAVVAGLAFREASGTAHAGGLIDRGGLADPTWEFYRAARGEAPSMPPSNASMVFESIRELYWWSWWWIVPAAILAGIGLWRARRDAAVRRALGFVLLSLVGIGAVACVFMLGWQGYVPRRTGASRLVLEASLLIPPLIVIGLSSAAGDMRLWRPRRLLPSQPSRALGLLAALSVFGAISLIGVARYDSGQAPSRDDLAVWRSLPLSTTDIVLANGYTEGFIPDVTAANGLLDGRAPYTFGDLLHRANGLFRGAQEFFADPAAHWDYVADNDVSWIVVADPDSHALGTGNVWETPTSQGLQALEQCDGLDQVVQSDALTAFRVVDAGPEGCAAVSP
jgi:hypothetical protein